MAAPSQPLISIVISVFNDEHYLRDSIASVRSIPERHREIILVDRGSTDRSLTIATHAARKDPHFRIISQGQSGIAAARNSGLAAATGRYITFLDSADLLQGAAFIELLDLAEHYNSDLVSGITGPISRLPLRFSFPQISRDTPPVLGTTIREVPEFLVAPELGGKVFRRDFLRRVPLYFDTDTPLGSETCLVLQAARWAQHIAMLARRVHLYRTPSSEKCSAPSLPHSYAASSLLSIARKLDADYSDIDTTTIRALRYQSLLRLVWLQLPSLLHTHVPESESEAVCVAIEELMRIAPAGASDSLPIRAAIALELIRSKRFLEARTLIRTKWWRLRAAHVSRLAASLPDADSNRVVRRSRIVQPSIESRMWNPSFFETVTTHCGNLLQFAHLFFGFLSSQIKLLLALMLSLFVRSARPVWVIGERRGLGIDDSGDQLCAYLLRNHPEIDVRFITSSTTVRFLSPEVRAHTLAHGSIRQLVFLCRAEVVIFTDCFEDVAPFWRWGIFSRWLTRRFIGVFLTHGFIAMSRAVGYYDNPTMLRRRERVDIVTVCAEQEKSFWVRGFGHPRDNVQITGIPRLDNLPRHERTCEASRRTILFIPTSRIPLRNASLIELRASRYYQEISTFLESSSLMDICKTHHAAVKLVLHHSMARLKESFRIFETERISVTDMESESVQQLLISGDLLITDYSSVAFDFLYMNRPVIFFQFDRAYFQANHGAPFIDLDTELPGPVAMTASEVEHHMRLAIQRGWKIDEQSRPKIENFFAFRDNQNCSRIVDAIYARLANCPEATSSKSPASCSLVDS